MAKKNILKPIASSPAVRAACNFTICLNLNGEDYLACSKLIRSLRRTYWSNTFLVRVGFHNVDEEIRDMAHRLGPEFSVEGHWPHSKYPMMRALFHRRPFRTKYVLWLDSGCFLHDSTRVEFFWMLQKTLEEYHVAGKLMNAALYGKQTEAIRDQPWYTGQPELKMAANVTFCEDAAWAVRADVLQRHDWPYIRMGHHDGDVIFGALCQQQGYKLTSFEDGIARNVKFVPKREFSKERWGYNYKSPIKGTKDAQVA